MTTQVEAPQATFPSGRESRRQRFWRIISYLGPAFLISVGYMDPGNWATDIEGGSRFGYSLLWVLLVSNVIALLLQTLSAKLGIVTGKTLPENCRERVPRWLNVVLFVAAEASTLATDMAEFLGAALGFSILFNLDMLPSALLAAVFVFGVLALDRFGYRVVEYAIIALVAVIGFAYLHEVLLAKPDVAALGRGLVVPELGGGRLYVAIAMLGATVMPHNLYLHSALVQARRPHLATRRHIKSQILDGVVALNGAFLVNAAILVMAAAVFFEHGVVVTSIEQAHETLHPLLGDAAPVLFAVALLASGLSSSTTATLAGQVVLQGFVQVRVGLFVQRLFTMLPALVVIAIGVDSLKILIFSQVFLSFGLPFAVIPLVWLTHSRGVMGEFANRRFTTAAASIAAALILVLNGLLVYEALGGTL